MKQVFTAEGQTLTIVAAQGKKGWNVKASLKELKGKGTPKAKTGARAKFDTEKDAKKAFDGLVKETLTRGWVKVDRAERNAFTEIPAAPVKAKK